MRKHLLALALLAAIALPLTAAAPNPGHDANSVGPGAFAPGNYSFNGSVGIGVVSPSQALHVGGNINTTGTLYAPQICLNGDCRSVWFTMQSPNGTGSAGRLVRWVNESQVGASSIYDNGTSVGLRTADPQATLDVNGTLRVSGGVALPAGAIESSSIASGAINATKLQASNTPSAGLLLAYNATSGGFYWAADASGGTMSSFTLAGTSGTPQAITEGNTMTIAAGTGITTTAAATDTIAVALNNTGVAAGTYGSSTAVPVIVVDAQGRLRTVTNTTIRSGTTAQSGIVQLTNSTGSTSTTTAATPASVKSAYDLANTANTLAASKAGTGNCPAGQVVMNTTSSGVQCVAMSTGSMSSWLLAASGTAGTQSITDGSTVNITAGTGIAVTRSGSTITITGTASDTDSRVAVDAGATPGYLGSAGSDGVLRVSAPLSYADGGDFVTLGITNDAIGDTQLAYNTGQHLTTSSSPSFAGLTSSGTVSTGALKIGNSSSMKYYPEVLSGNYDGTATGAWIIHTPIPRASNVMFSIRVRGYAYGSADAIDFTVVGYSYSSINGSIDGLSGAVNSYDLIDSGTDKWEKYVGVDENGNVAVAFGNSSGSAYFYRLAVDAWITRSTTDFSTGWSVNQSTAADFGWRDLKGPLGRNQYSDNLYDADGSNFFDGACGDNQHVSGISSTGAITCAANSADISAVTAGNGLAGGAASGAATLSLNNTGVAAGSYGSATQVGAFTVDATGRLTAAGSTAIQSGTTSQAGLVQLTNSTSSTSTTTAATPASVKSAYDLANTANTLAASKAGTGNCPAGQVVMNTTSSGVQCVAMSTGSMSSWVLAASGTAGTQSITDGSTVNITAGTGIAVTRSGSTITVTNTGDTNAGDDLTTGTTFSGDVSGAYNNLQLGTGVVGSAEVSDGSLAHTDVAFADQNLLTTSAVKFDSVEKQYASGSNGFRVIHNPDGAQYTSNVANVAGAVKITLPVNMTNTMMYLVVRGFEYDVDGSWELITGGYNAPTGWNNEFAVITSGNPPFTRVRFGTDGTNATIVLGTVAGDGAATDFDYPKIWISELGVGYSGVTNNWDRGWSMDVITDTTGITFSGDEQAIESWNANNDGSGSGLDADLLDGQNGTYYQAASTALTTGTAFSGDVSGAYNNLQLGAGVVGATEIAGTAVAAGSYGSASSVSTFTVDADGRLTAAGSAGISIAASQVTSGELDEARVRKLDSADTRATNPEPQSYTSSVQADFKQNAADGLADGGTYHGVLTFRPYGTAADFSGGSVYQLAFTANGNLYMRQSTGAATWGSWSKTWHAGNDGSGSGLDADTVDGAACSDGQVLEWSGSGWVCGSDDSGVTGGSANKLAYWTSATGLAYNADLHWDNANARLGVGDVTPDAKLTIAENGESTTKTVFTQGVANAGILINTEYTANAYTPGLFWATADTPARPKAGIYLYETSSGTYVHMGTSNSYATGITNDGIVIDPAGNVDTGADLRINGNDIKDSGNSNRITFSSGNVIVTVG